MPMGATTIVQTARMTLVNASPAMAHAIGANDHTALGASIGADVPIDWPPELLKHALPFVAQWHEKVPNLGAWGMWLFMLKPGAIGAGSPERCTLIGSGGFKGPPPPLPEGGDVEVGYGLLPAFHRRGLGSEATRALIAWAFGHDDVRRVIADTLPGHEPSLGVMRNCGMVHLGAGPTEEGMETVRYGVTRDVFLRHNGHP